MISSSPSKRVAKATGYLVFMEQLAATCATASESRVEIDERLVTSRGPGTTIEFSLTLIEQLYEKEKAGSSIVLPLFSGNGILSRLSSIFLGFAPPFLLLSIGYEAVFYIALAVVLMAWILFENASHHSSKVKDSSLSDQNREEHVTIGSDEREIHERNVRI